MSLKEKPRKLTVFPAAFGSLMELTRPVAIEPDDDIEVMRISELPAPSGQERSDLRVWARIRGTRLFVLPSAVHAGDIVRIRVLNGQSVRYCAFYLIVLGPSEYTNEISGHLFPSLEEAEQYRSDTALFTGHAGPLPDQLRRNDEAIAIARILRDAGITAEMIYAAASRIVANHLCPTVPPAPKDQSSARQLGNAPRAWEYVRVMASGLKDFILARCPDLWVDGLEQLEGRVCKVVAINADGTIVVWSDAPDMICQIPEMVVTRVGAANSSGTRFRPVPPLPDDEEDFDPDGCLEP